MKMPTAVVRHRVPHRPGDQVCPPGEGSLSPDDRFPAVSAVNGGTSVVPNPPPSSRDEVVLVPKILAIETSLPTSAGPEGIAKRFPNLGPTRQDTELYFRRRRSGRHRIRTQARPLVTRSADRVVAVDNSPARLMYTTFSSLSHHSDTASSGKAFRHVEIDPYGVQNHAETTRSALPSFDSDPQAMMTSFQGFEQSRSSSSQAYAKPLTAFTRTGSSPAVNRASVPLLDRSLTCHAGLEPVSAGIMVRSGGGKRSEIPIKFLSESGHIRNSDLIHRVSRISSQQNQKPSQSQKTLQPSKYGFHRRSKSPTFMRLVEVAEKLQNVVFPDSDLDSPRSHDSHVHVTSPAHIHLPAVGVEDSVDDCGAGESGAVGDEDGERTCLPPDDLLPSFTPRQSQRGAANCFKHRNSNYAGKTSRQTSPRKVLLPYRSDIANNHLQQDFNSTPDRRDVMNGWGAWESASGAGTRDDVDPLRLMVSAGLTQADSHTELHLFLPRLADTPSEEGGSAVAAMPSPERGRSKVAPQTQQLQVSGGVWQRGKTSLTHPHTSVRPPHHPQASQGVPSMAERNGRAQTKRFNSPVRVVRRDRTPKRRSLTSDLYESYEPFIKGEHLKEKLEDFPTLISLDLGRQTSH